MTNNLPHSCLNCGASMTGPGKLDERITEIACTYCADYPKIKEVETWEKFYAIESMIEGINLAIEDWCNLHKEKQERIDKLEKYNSILLAHIKLLQKNCNKKISLSSRGFSYIKQELE